MVQPDPEGAIRRNCGTTNVLQPLAKQLEQQRRAHVSGFFEDAGIYAAGGLARTAEMALAAKDRQLSGLHCSHYGAGCGSSRVGDTFFGPLTGTVAISLLATQAIPFANCYAAEKDETSRTGRKNGCELICD